MVAINDFCWSAFLTKSALFLKFAPPWKKNSGAPGHTPIDVATVKIAGVKAGEENWEIHGSQSRWSRFVDVDYFITINVYTQPLNLRCRWRLVQKRVFQSLVDKRGKNMLPA